MGVIKKDILLPKPDQMVVPAYHGSMFGSPDVNNVKSFQPVGAATVYYTATNLGYAQFYGTTTSTDACTTLVSLAADAHFDRHRSHAKTTNNAATIPAFLFSPPTTPAPFVSVPGIPVFTFGATEAARAPLDPLRRYAHQQHFRQSSIDELYEADLHARTAQGRSGSTAT
jgi:hypothetical protein